MSECKESGSGRHTKVIVVSRVFKEATDEKVRKLADEIKFLESIPKEWKRHFPEIVFSHVGRNKAFYEMPDYRLPTIRNLLFSSKWTHTEALEWIDKILKFSFKMYRHEVIPQPRTYVQELHWKRLENRLEQLRTWTTVFRPILNLRNIEINGREYVNTPILLQKIRDLEELVYPEFVSKWGHFDMHFSNVLIDEPNDNFIYIDPRGYEYCDYYYDFGKLWHSVNGKYEFIAENRFTLSDTNFDLEKNQVFWECEGIRRGLPKILQAYSGEDGDTVMRKTEFNEAVHFASLVPFILDYDGVERRARVGYYTGVMLLNRWYEKYG